MLCRLTTLVLLGVTCAAAAPVRKVRPAPTRLDPGAKIVDVRVNFQPPAAEAPTDHVPDTGRPFGDHGNGLSYGWDADNSAAAVRRGAFTGPSTPHDTFILTQQSGDCRWELAVPDGWYVVRLLAGDASSNDGVYQFDVEGVRVIDAVPSSDSRWAEGAAAIEVRDGRLTVTNGPGARNNRICSIAVRSAHDPRRVMAWLNIGQSSPVETDRHVGWDIKKTGWRGYVKRYVEPQIRWGARRITVQNPFGCLDGEDMQFDQYLHARRARLRWLTGGFVDAWKPLTDRGVEVICYLGAISSDPDFIEPAAVDPVAGWQPRFWASVQPALSAGMDVAFDASSGATLESTTFRAMRLLEERGVRTYIEARPMRTLPHLFEYPVYSTDTFWRRSDPTVHADSAQWAPREEELKHEIIRIITASPEGKTWADKGWIAPLVREILEDGHTAAVPVELLMRERVALVDLLERRPSK